MDAREFVDMVVLGLGPAGLALAHRAQARGWEVLGVDPQTQWPNTFGVFADELPLWLADAPGIDTAAEVRMPGWRRTFRRTYRILDGEALRRRFDTIPHYVGAAEQLDEQRVRLDDGRVIRARIIVDARGARPAPVVQQAAGVFLDAPPQRRSVWMDFTRSGDTFSYVVPTPRGLLVEHTLLAGPAMPQEELRRRVAADAAGLGTRTGETEDVLIPLGPGVDGAAYGARAGMINPITGYQVATAFKLVDATLDALAAGRTLPHRRLAWRVDDWLLRRGQAVLVALLDTPGATREFFAEVLALPEPLLWGLLTPGRPLATMRGMAAVFLRLPWRLRVLVLRSVGRRMGAYERLPE
ncbi:lycopene cyclase family protein [Corynebacterium sp. 13CS0277]|uniref:lycopene cyclase family protein n=1 Tax=Corynebacterium sp. 13CS0277 TaxID=2071994 RepID=UPI001304BA52|nr:lycopene cyclase family protein [Corynebacterium sp. 13CS0277]